MAKRDEWVRVKSESELRAGMCVEVRVCSWCGKRERNILLRDCGVGLGVCSNGVMEKGRMFEIAGGCQQKSDADEIAFDVSIRNGRLYRLSDSQLTESEATQELERVR